MPVGAYAGTMQLLLPYLAYKFKNIRSYLVFGAQVGTTVAALLLWVLPISSTGALLFGCIIMPSVGAGYAVLMGLQLANIAGYTKRSIASSGLYIGYCLGEYYHTYSDLAIQIPLLLTHASRELRWPSCHEETGCASLRARVYRSSRDLDSCRPVGASVSIRLRVAQPQA